MWPFIVAIIVLILLGVIIFMIFPDHATELQRAPFQDKKFAHRGLHTKDKSVPENSLEAFRRACLHGYGIELDIQFSKDEQIVVFHDDTLDRVCGVHGRVDDFTYEELSKMSLCGTAETIPLFSEVLRTVSGRVPLIVELKNGPKNELLCEKSLEMLREYHGDFCIESFQPAIVKWYRKNAPDIVRGQLSSNAKDLSGGGKVKFSSWALANMLCDCISRPQFIAYNKNIYSPLAKLVGHLGAMRVVWTVRDDDDIEKINSLNDVVIFEFYEP